jgi:hypothetical protein
MQLLQLSFTPEDPLHIGRVTAGAELVGDAGLYAAPWALPPFRVHNASQGGACLLMLMLVQIVRPSPW